MYKKKIPHGKRTSPKTVSSILSLSVILLFGANQSVIKKSINQKRNYIKDQNIQAASN